MRTLLVANYQRRIAASNAQKTKVYDRYARCFRWVADRVNSDGFISNTKKMHRAMRQIASTATASSAIQKRCTAR